MLLNSNSSGDGGGSSKEKCWNILSGENQDAISGMSTMTFVMLQTKTKQGAHLNGFESVNRIDWI